MQSLYACITAYLQHYRELLWRIPVLHTHRQPHLKRCQLLCEERAVLWMRKKIIIKDVNSLTHFHPLLTHTSSLQWLAYYFTKRTKHNELRSDTALQQQHKSWSIMITFSLCSLSFCCHGSWPDGSAHGCVVFDHVACWNCGGNYDSTL